MDSELATMNEKSSTELEIMNDENNTDLITSSINLTDKVKKVFENLVIDHFRHINYQSACFEELINLWLGENFLVTSPILDIEKETERFDNDVKAYLLETIAKNLPEGDKELYSAYNTFRSTGNIELNCTIYHKEQIDIKQFRQYINIIKEKILRQYNNLKYNFGVYLKDKLEDAEFHKLNNNPVLFPVRRSERKTTILDYKPMLQFKNTKNKKTITYFLKTNSTSNTASKKRKVKPFYCISTMYI
jgi:hypothetical protein